jgi:hypothetical protein
MSDVNAHGLIRALLDDYFAGLYDGDVERLRAVFLPTAVLWGDVKGEPYYRSLTDWLNGVRNRASPRSLGEPFAMRAVSIAVEGSVAVAQVRCPMLGFSYVDFLSLVEREGGWFVAAKVFTHQRSPSDQGLRPSQPR